MKLGTHLKSLLLGIHASMINLLISLFALGFSFIVSFSVIFCLFLIFRLFLTVSLFFYLSLSPTCTDIDTYTYVCVYVCVDRYIGRQIYS